LLRGGKKVKGISLTNKLAKSGTARIDVRLGFHGLRRTYDRALEWAQIGTSAVAEAETIPTEATKTRLAGLSERGRVPKSRDSSKKAAKLVRASHYCAHPGP
jgi:hypothetical protein